MKIGIICPECGEKILKNYEGDIIFLTGFGGLDRWHCSCEKTWVIDTEELKWAIKKLTEIQLCHAI
jgi:hypothetical protein